MVLPIEVFSEQDGGSGGIEEDIKGYQILGAKILSEKKGSARKTFCQSCGSNQCTGSLIGCVLACFSVFSKVREN